MTQLSKEYLPPCVICKKVWQRKDTDKYVYHNSKGVVCRHHEGVKEWFWELVQKANKELEDQGITMDNDGR